MTRPLTLQADQTVSLKELYAVAAANGQVALHKDLEPRLAASRALLQDQVDQNLLVYGVTSGFGPLGDRILSPDQTAELQRNLVYHLATGVGPDYSRSQTRAIMCARLINLTKGYSAVTQATPALLAAFLNQDVTPAVPSLGTVGASGDLTPLAHVALALMGESEVTHAGERISASEALKLLEMPALNPADREALGLVNGTSAMTGIAALNGVDAQRAFDIALDLGVLHAEVMQGDADAWHPLLALARPHPGQEKVCAHLRKAAAQSKRLQYRSSQSFRQLKPSGWDSRLLPEPFQDPYSSRCLPQIYGAIAEVLDFHNGIVTRELNSATDNPLFFAAEGQVIHGGNFYGQHVSFASDALANAVIKMGIHLERKVARICNPKLNRGLPPLLHGGKAGLHSGFMGAQVTATALVAHMRGRSTPLSVQSISTNLDNQDVVSMGTLAAQRTAALLEDLYSLLAIDALTLARAFDLCADDAAFCPDSRAWVAKIRTVSPPFEADRPLSGEIKAVAEMLRT